MASGTGMVSARGAAAANGLAVTARSRPVLMRDGRTHLGVMVPPAESQRPASSLRSVLPPAGERGRHLGVACCGLGHCSALAPREQCSHMIALGVERVQCLVQLGTQCIPITAPVWGTEGAPNLSD